MLEDAEAASDMEVIYCLIYLNKIEACMPDPPKQNNLSETNLSEIEFVRRHVKMIGNELARTSLSSRSITSELNAILIKLPGIVSSIKSGEIKCDTVKDVVIESGIQAELTKYRESLLDRFCKFFTAKAEKDVVKAENYYGFTYSLAYIVLLMKITGKKIRKVVGLTTSQQKVNIPDDTSDKKIPKDYKKLLGDGWFAKAVYNKLRAVIPPTDNSTMDSV